MTDEREDQQQPEETSQDGGPDVSELDKEPDYNPDVADEEGLKDLKGG
jgi:hypothetical protein